MIKKIRIKNFKCYGPRGADFNLSKINFIFGDNSAGKSTFLQFLEMIGAMFDHVGYYNRNAIDKYLFKQKGQIGAFLRVTSDFESNESVWTFRLDNSQKEYELVDEKGSLIKRENLDRILPVPRGKDHIVHKEANRASKSLKSRTQTGGLTDLEPLAFVESDKNAIDYLDDIFARLNIPYSCVPKGSLIDENKIHDNDFDIDLPLREVGTGIEGLIELAFTLKDWKGGILALEEPETNINEKQLAKLTDVLIDEAKQKSGQLIVECHSELMFLELRNLLVHKKLNPEDISLIVVQKGKMGSIVTHIPVDQYGNIQQPWPGGLFPERVNIADAYYD